MDKTEEESWLAKFERPRFGRLWRPPLCSVIKLCKHNFATLAYGLLFGEDARRFLARMEERHPEPPEVRAHIQRNYEFFKKAYERGMAKMRAREEANGGDDPCFRTV